MKKGHQEPRSTETKKSTNIWSEQARTKSGTLSNHRLMQKATMKRVQHFNTLPNLIP